MPRMPAEERRSKLIEAALRVISRGGVSAATTRAVAAEAQMPLASFHYVFESQQELMRELVLAVAERQTTVLGQVEFDADDPATGVSALLNSYIDYVVANRGAELAVFEINHYALRTPGMEELALVHVEAERAIVRSAIKHFESRYGAMKTDIDDVANIVMAVANGLANMLVNEGDVDAARAVVRLLAPQIEAIAFGEAGSRA